MTFQFLEDLGYKKYHFLKTYILRFFETSKARKEVYLVPRIYPHPLFDDDLIQIFFPAKTDWRSLSRVVIRKPLEQDH